MTVTVLGVRHHGPGSAKAVGAALTELDPDVVLVEGPPEAEAVVALAASEEMRPPVALLVHAVGDPALASFYPLAAFSPEWVAIRHATSLGLPLRFIDLPAVNALALERADAELETERARLAPDDPDGDAAEGSRPDASDPEPAMPPAGLRRTDPIAMLAHAAGHDDPERWWEDVVEHQGDGALDRFAAIAAAMAELRQDEPAADPASEEARREAAMRRAVRAAERDGFERIAVICGAWHAPALARDTFPPAARDDAILRGLPKTKVAATWVPWTNDRLAFSSGYGAGVDSPGWYHHLFTAPDLPVTRWLQRTASLLRDEGLGASPASVVEAVRLADTLAAVRSRPLAGLGELHDAALAVFCQGDEAPMQLIARLLVVGEVLGQVPASTPMVPLVQDLAARQRSLRLPAEASSRDRELDLRKDNDLSRSHLLHRLNLLGVPWGTVSRSQSRTTGTFKEVWQLAWQPEFAVSLIDASRYGGTVEAAATALAGERAASAETLAELTALVEICLLAALPTAIDDVMRALSDRAATDADVGQLMDALEPLTTVQRYGSVRRQDASAIDAAVEGIAVRICVGLPSAVGGLDDDAARSAVGRIEASDRAFALPALATLRDEWHRVLGSVAGRPDVHGLVAGRITRLLLDATGLDGAEARRRLEFELSSAADAARGAAWLEGFLSGTGLVLLHDRDLLAIVDTWMSTVAEPRFNDVLPILRRAFSQFPFGERRQIGAAIRIGPAADRRAATGSEPTIDTTRAEAALATVLELLG